MNHIYQPLEINHVFRLSDAAEYHQREEGFFEVRYNNTAAAFHTLLKAFLFYLRLDVAATLWDLTEGTTMIERKIVLNTN